MCENQCYKKVVDGNTFWYTEDVDLWSLSNLSHLRMVSSYLLTVFILVVIAYDTYTFFAAKNHFSKTFRDFW